MEKIKDELVLELSDYADITIEKGIKIKKYLNENYIIKEKKKNKIKENIKNIIKKDSVSYYLENEKKGRYDYIDIAKAIAMIFIFLGHWQSKRIGIFAYSFHLQLFFMASGFFALHLQKVSFLEMLKKMFKRIILPLFFWSLISYIILNLDSINAIKNIPDLFLKTGEIQPNYWFLPALLVCVIIYWLLAKIIKKPWLIVFITLLLYLFLGKDSFIQFPINFQKLFQKFPLYYWFELDRFFTWGFWYSLGAASLPILINYIDGIDSSNKKRKTITRIIGYLSITLTIYIFLHNSNFDSINKIKILRTFYIIIRALIIITSIYYLSYYLKNSKILNKIGKNTMIFIGMEFLLHDFLAITLMQTFNLGFYNFVNSSSLIFYVLISLFIIYKFIDPINNHLPILNGKTIKK